MSDWIKQAKEREDTTRLDRATQETIRMAEVERLKTAFPAWQHLLFVELKDVCKELGTAFQNDLTRHYSVNIKANGYTLRSQGFPETTIDLEFHLEMQTMVVKHIVKQSMHDTHVDSRQNNGRIKLTESSEVFISYNPILLNEGSFTRVQSNYSNPKVLANDLLRESTGL